MFRKAIGEASFTKTDAAITATSIEHLGLTPNCYYSYYIVAKNASGDSIASSTVGAYTNAAIPGISSANSGDTNNLTIISKGNPTALSGENPDGTEYYIEYTTDGDEVAEKTWMPLTGQWITYLSPQHSGNRQRKNLRLPGKGPQQRRRGNPSSAIWRAPAATRRPS